MLIVKAAGNEEKQHKCREYYQVRFTLKSCKHLRNEEIMKRPYVRRSTMAEV